MKREKGLKQCKFYIHKLDVKKSKLSKEEAKMFPSYLNYDTKLELILYGEPIADSRPRVTRGIAFSKNIGILRKHFAPLYESNELLKRTLIDSPYHLGFKFYMSPSKKIKTKITGTTGKKARPKNKKLYEMFIKDKIHDMSIKDCDNMMKIYNDLFMTERARITLDDGFNIGVTSIDKFMSLNPRTVITIYYSSNPIGYFVDLMHDHYSYFKFKMSEKHMYMHNRDYKQQLKFLEGLFNIEFHDLKGSALLDKLKQVLVYFEENYSAELIYKLVEAIGYMKDYKKMNRTVHINILLLHLFRKNKEVHNMLTKTVQKYERLIGGEEF